MANKAQANQIKASQWPTRLKPGLDKLYKALTAPAIQA
jgi:hypothetical protein